MAYDHSNVFAKILRGELPAQKVYEDAETLAFMDIMPRCEGHMLVVPKTPARNILDANPAQLAACIKTVQKVSAAAMKAFDIAVPKLVQRLFSEGKFDGIIGMGGSGGSAIIASAMRAEGTAAVGGVKRAGRKIFAARCSGKGSACRPVQRENL